MMKQTFEVKGMSCQHCVSTVEKAITELDGVKKVKVNLKKENAVVKFDESTLTADKIISAINESGYSTKVLG